MKGEIKTKIYTEWKKYPEVQLSYQAIYYRYKKGIPLEEIFNREMLFIRNNSPKKYRDRTKTILEYSK